MCLRSFIRLKTFARGSMNYIYERRLSPCLENHFPAACSFSVNSLCRAVYLGGFADTHTRTFLQVLDEASSFQSSIFLALCDTGYYRNFLVLWAVKPCLKVGVWLAVVTFFTLGFPLYLFAFVGGFFLR